MDWMQIFFSFAITIFVYLFVPVVIILTGKKFKLKTLKIIGVANWFLCFILFSLCLYIIEPGRTANPSPAMIWSLVGYYLMKKRCILVDDDTLSDSSPVKPSDPNKFKTTSFSKWLPCILLITNIILIALVVYLCFNITAQLDHISKLETNYNELREDLYYVTDLDIPEIQKYLDKIDEVIGVEPSNPYADTHLEWRLKRLEDALDIWP